MDVDFKIDEMSIEQLRELARSLIRLARVENELIQTMQNRISLLENHKESN